MIEAITIIVLLWAAAYWVGRYEASYLSRCSTLRPGEARKNAKIQFTKEEGYLWNFGDHGRPKGKRKK